MNRVGLQHVALAEFFLRHLPARFTCVGYDLAPCRELVFVVVADESLAPKLWPSRTLGLRGLEGGVVDVAARGSAVRDVLFLLAQVGAVRLADHHVSLRDPDQPYRHRDYACRTPFGAIVAARPRYVGHVLRAAVFVALLKPWTGLASTAWRTVLKPVALTMGVVGGFHAIRAWFGM